MKQLIFIITLCMFVLPQFSIAEPVGPIELVGQVVKYNQNQITIHVDGKELTIPRSSAVGDIAANRQRAVFKLSIEEYLKARETAKNVRK